MGRFITGADRSQVQGEAIHVVAQRLDDLSSLLASVGGCGELCLKRSLQRLDHSPVFGPSIRH